MKSNKKIVKKATSIKKPISKKTAPRGKSPSKKVSVKKSVVSKKRPIIVKKVISKKKAKKAKSIGLLIIATGVIAAVISGVFLLPNVIASLFSKDSSVLHTNVVTANQYTVNEDDLLMFATLSYETPSTTSEYVSPFNALHPKSEQPVMLKSHYTNGVINPLITRSKVLIDDSNVDSAVSTDQKNLMLSDENPNNQYMYSANDMTGTTYEDKLVAKNIDSVSDVLGHLSQWMFTAFIGKEPTEQFYFSGIASLASSKATAGNLKGWDAVEYFESKTQDNNRNDYGKISAVTFKRGKDIVISYRGTDLTDLVDWIGVDGGYGIKNNTAQDELARKYALHVAKIYNSDLTGNDRYNIYITGHSLGGYLSQIAGASLLGTKSGAHTGSMNADNSVDNPYNLKRIVYFNGMGLFFSNKSTVNPANDQIAARDKLVAFNAKADGTKDDKILLVHMFGDPVSAIGVHFGQYKEMNVAKDIVASHNKFYKLATSSIIDSVCAALGATTLCNDAFSTPTVQSWSSTNLATITNAITSTMAKWKANINVDQVSNSVANLAAAGEPFHGILPYFMSSHETDSFFYTKKYYDMVKANLDHYGPANINNEAALPTISSINDGISYTATDTIAFAEYGAPQCTFWSSYQYTHKITFLDKPGQVFKAMYLNPVNNKTLTGRITCSSAAGFSDTKITNSDIIYEDNYPIYNIAYIKVDNENGKPVSIGNTTAYYWDVTITPQKRILSTKVRDGIVTRFSLRSNAVIGSDTTKKNVEVPFPYLIDTTNDSKPAPVYIGLPSAIPNATTNAPAVATAPLVPLCGISVPVTVKANIWPFYKDYSAIVTCTSKTLLTESVISSSDLVSSPSGRLLIQAIGGATRVGVSGAYTYRWNVVFRGARSSAGVASFNLRAKAVSNSEGGNLSTSSSYISVTR